MEDIYSVLGLPPTASAEDVRAAFLKAQKKFHPDVRGAGEPSKAVLTYIQTLNALYTDYQKAAREAGATRSENSGSGASAAASQGTRAQAQSGAGTGRARDSAGQEQGKPYDLWGHVFGFNRGELPAARALLRALSCGSDAMKKGLAAEVVEQIDFSQVGTQDHFQFVYDELEARAPQRFYQRGIAFMAREMTVGSPLSGRYATIIGGYIRTADDKSAADPSMRQRATWLRNEVLSNLSDDVLRDKRFSGLHVAVFGHAYEPPSPVQRSVAFVNKVVAGGIKRMVNALG